jgi:predicted transcriptional regulator
MEEPMADREHLLGLAAGIVSAHVSNNAVPPDQLSTLIERVFGALAAVEQKTAEPPRPDPAVPIKRSVTADHLVCLECGRHFSTLKRHLAADHELTPEQYRQRWGLPRSYPLLAPNYAKVRSALAKKIGLAGKADAPAMRKTGRRRGKG